MAKKKVEKVDGLGPKEIAQIRVALRKVWSWSHARRLVIKRCEGKGGFSFCEKCKKRAPKIFVDHLKKCGEVDDGYIRRLFVSSDKMQGLCNKCHNKKTKWEKEKDFY